MARHLYTCPLRWSDMDAFGHVNNVVFLRYLEEARVDFMWRLAPEGGGDAFSGGVVVARHEIDYLKPLVHRHAPVSIETWVTKIGAAFVSLAYEVKDEAAVYVRAATVLVPYDLRASQPRRLTREERAFLEEYRDDEGADGAAAGPGADGKAGGAAGSVAAAGTGATRDGDAPDRGGARRRGGVVAA